LDVVKVKETEKEREDRKKIDEERLQRKNRPDDWLLKKFGKKKVSSLSITVFIK